MITKAEAGRPHWESCASHRLSAWWFITTSERRGHQGRGLTWLARLWQVFAPQPRSPSFFCLHLWPWAEVLFRHLCWDVHMRAEGKGGNLEDSFHHSDSVSSTFPLLALLPLFPNLDSIKLLDKSCWETFKRDLCQCAVPWGKMEKEGSIFSLVVDSYLYHLSK